MASESLELTPLTQRGADDRDGGAGVGGSSSNLLPSHHSGLVSGHHSGAASAAATTAGRGSFSSVRSVRGPAGLAGLGLSTDASTDIIRFEELATDGTRRTDDLVSAATARDGGTGSGPPGGNKDGPGWKLPLDLFERKYVDVDAPAGRRMNPAARDFYRSQNEQIDAFREASLMDSTTAEASRERDRRNVVLERRATIVSAVANVLLLVILLLAVIFSGSIALIASLMDGALDNFSTIIIVLTTYYRKRVNPYRHPQGRERLEPVGILIFSSVMGTASLMLIIEAIRRLAETPNEPPDTGILAISLIAVDIAVKLGLFLYCYRYAKRSAIAAALAQDHRNDVLVNSVALISSILASLYWAPLDSIGAMCICSWTAYNWGQSCLEQVHLLTGVSASPEFLKRLTFICYNHDEQIVGIDTVRAFHFGNRFLVEIDVVLPPQMTLHEAHDIGESLQKKVESLDEVERAFVHLDFETSHDPTSEHKQWGNQSKSS